MSQKSAIRIPAGSSSLPSGRGFTLIELLVVVAIIVLLVSILFPSLSNARTQAKRVQCASNVRQVVQSNLIYAQSENNILPGSAGTSQGVTGEWGNLVFFGPSQMVASGYLKSPKILFNPDRQPEIASFAYDPDNWARIPMVGQPLPPGYVSGVWRANCDYLYREPSSAGGWQQITTYASSYIEPYRTTDLNIRALVADLFCGNYMWSAHGGTLNVGVPNESVGGGNGTGWHVGYMDGHVTFQKNDTRIYQMANPNVGAQWGTRAVTWSYWDQNQ